MEKSDIGIIGGGPAGYTLGMMYAKQGKSVIIFEKDKLGGTCLNKGCIPTKTFLHYSDLYAQFNKLWKNETENVTNINKYLPPFEKIVEKKNQTVEKIRKSLELAVKNSGAKTIYADACVKDKNTVSADGIDYVFDKIVIATGAKPRVIAGLEYDGEFIISSDDILDLQTLPASILIVGSGAIGIEWARILSNFGAEVTVVEIAEHLIPPADIEVSKRIERIFKQNKIKFYLNDCVESVNNRTVKLKSGAELNPEKILVAVGRTPVCPKCDCENVIGDACGEIQLAHYAIHQAKSEALGIPFDKKLVPSVIYGEPEIAWIGIREQDMDYDCKKVILPITALGKAWCDDSTDGFIKLITKNNKILGAHIISKEASSLIHIILLAIQKGLSTDDIKEICFAHPTYAEGIFELMMNC